ncbi:MAG TPA: lipopolysaccharide kinase InaA family protein [Pirellulales bacterium]|nr:lipopolysaccharide kinase InaA family protein [Pirellulales bacterium]
MPPEIWIAPPFRRSLQSAGLETFDDVMNATSGTKLRAVATRENWRFDLPAVEDRPRGAYLKKHRVPKWSLRLRSWLRLAPRISDGRQEAENIAALERDGIPAMRLIAFGERLTAAGRLDSFVLTEALEGFTQLDHYLRRRFAPRSASPGPRDRSLSQLIDRVADVARRFHACGYNHRDLYCCHFFIREAEPDEFCVRLIDLQRVQQRRWFRRRWIVKDLAQLSYSAPIERLGPTQRMAFIKRYLGVRKLGPADKRLIRSVLAKHDRMQRRLGPHP